MKLMKLYGSDNTFHQQIDPLRPPVWPGRWTVPARSHWPPGNLAGVVNTPFMIYDLLTPPEV